MTEPAALVAPVTRPLRAGSAACVPGGIHLHNGEPAGDSTAAVRMLALCGALLAMGDGMATARPRAVRT